jgi:hypothetical protein
VCEFVRAREGPAVVGDYDEGVGENGDDCGCAYRTEAERARGDRSVARTNEAITAENRSFLRGLRDGIDLELGDLAVALVHGSPRRVNGYLHEDRPDASLERLLDLAEADVLVRGHTRRGGPTSRRSRSDSTASRTASYGGSVVGSAATRRYRTVPSPSRTNTARFATPCGPRSGRSIAGSYARTTSRLVSLTRSNSMPCSSRNSPRGNGESALTPSTVAPASRRRSRSSQCDHLGRARRRERPGEEGDDHRAVAEPVVEVEPFVVASPRRGGGRRCRVPGREHPRSVRPGSV